MSTLLNHSVATRVPAPACRLVAEPPDRSLAAAAGDGDTAASCSVAVAARRIQWVNTPVLLEAMERHRQGLLPRPMQLWLEQLLELPADSPPPERTHGPGTLS